MVAFTGEGGLQQSLLNDGETLVPTFRTSVVAFDWYRIAFFLAGAALVFVIMRRTT